MRERDAGKAVLENAHEQLEAGLYVPLCRREAGDGECLFGGKLVWIVFGARSTNPAVVVDKGLKLRAQTLYLAPGDVEPSCQAKDEAGEADDISAVLCEHLDGAKLCGQSCEDKVSVVVDFVIVDFAGGDAEDEAIEEGTVDGS
jgi:hypothetical protein